MTVRLAELENVRVSLTPDDRLGIMGHQQIGAVLLGTLTLGTVVVDAVAPAQGFRSLAWLLPEAWVYVRPIGRRGGPPPAPGELVYARATVDWIDWPGVYLRGGEVWTVREEEPPRRRR